MARRVAIVAGEVSGDQLGAALVRAVRRQFPDVEFYGIAGPAMQAAGARTLVPMEKLSVRGYVEALRSLPELVGIRSQLGARFIADKPDLFIGIDAPDFNLGLERRLKRAGIRTVHYVSPSIWAWRPGRIDAIRRSVDHMLNIFPFEDEIYRRAGIPSTFVGHPLADQLPLTPARDQARAQLRLPLAQQVIALLPGSRRSEVSSHAGLCIKTAARLAARYPEARFLVPLATRETRRLFEEALYACGAEGLNITILFGHARLALQAADVALVASGTATLEAALARCPMVITYRVPGLTSYLMRRTAIVPYAGLPNILAGEFIVPEFFQDDATPENLSRALRNWLEHRGARALLQQRYEALHWSLRRDNEASLLRAIAPFLANAREQHALAA